MSGFSKPGLLRRMTLCALELCEGDVQRDASGRVNWRCGRCGAWSNPVPAEDEARVIAAIKSAQSSTNI